MASKKATVEALLERHGRTYAEELGIDISSGRPSALFQLLCAAILYSARIDARIATKAARNLKRRWRTAKALADSTWQQRVDAVHEAGYVRYDERTATMLGETAEHVRDRWGGDLRKLRDEADRDPKAERKLLKEAKGLGDVGVDIFFREAQVAWEELAPFADRRALAAARRLELARDADGLRRLADGRAELARLVAALVRTDLADDYDDVRAAAR
jgi:endonuclease III